MPDSFLLLVPLLVLAVVLVSGFTGCSFTPGVLASPALILSATVPADLSVVGGVMFTWTAPQGPDHHTVTTPTSPVPSLDAYIQAALGAMPSLLWTLGHDGGAADQSPNQNDGTLLGGVTVGGDPAGPTDFPEATATLFDGTDDGIGSAYNPFIGTAPRTFVGWARWEAGGANEYTLFGSSAGDNNRPNLRIVVASRDVKWLPSGDDGRIATWSAAAAAEGEWFMWALVAVPDPVNGNATLFINGQRISQQTITEPWPGSPGTFQAALGGTTRHPFTGAQGLVAVYEGGLSDAQLVALYQASMDPGALTYQYQLPSLDPSAEGSWVGRCEMTVQRHGQSASASSSDHSFTLTAGTQTLSFHATGSPETPPFEVIFDGLS